MDIYRSTVGKEKEVILQFGAVTGLILGLLDAVEIYDGLTIVSSLDVGMSLTEISSSLAPGLYVLKFTPRREGTLLVRLTEGVIVNVFCSESELAVPPEVVDPSLEGDYKVTLTSGGSPVSGAVVRAFDSTGAVLVARSLTDTYGETTLPLEVGQYQLRFSKAGYDFSSQNPTSITVTPNDNVTPQITELLPSTGSIGTWVTVVGKFFHLSSTQVLFGSQVASATTNGDLTVALVQVPVGVTETAVPVRVRKPDPGNVGSYLTSNVLTFIRV